MSRVISVGVVLLVACGGRPASRDSATATPPSTRPDSSASATSVPASGASATSTAATTTTKTTGVPPATRSTGSQTTAPAAADTLRGIISVNGTDRDHHTMIAPSAGRRAEITGPLAVIIGRTAGADVWVSGRATGTSLAADRFVVRTVDGAPAIDGTLKLDGTALYIVTADGVRNRILNPPPAFQGRDGARVWITGDPARAVASYGFIDPAR